ncbi:MAG: histidinol dehydrogenase [Terriglobales bacterium]
MRVIEAGVETCPAVVTRELVERTSADLATVETAVGRIVADVRRDGDGALRRYAGKWDGLAPGQSLLVAPEEIQAAWDSVTTEFKAALKQAASNIRQFCKWQKPREWMRSMRPGLRVGQLVRPLDAVGCYVPGGRYPLPSTLLMTVIPAQVAGVDRITVVSPRPAPQTLAAAALLGVDTVYRVGGAQAIAALAYGTNTIAKVDKIVGPGSLYVTAAKKMVAWDCAIDFLAGPTEVVLVSDDGEPSFLASDLVAQAEHDPHATAIFVTSSRALARAVQRETERQSRNNPTAQQSLKDNGVIVIAASSAQALEIANAIAPEHLTVAREHTASVRNAGSVFIGDYSPQAMGDYASGPNHVLPTGAVARYRGGLSVLDFVKIISVQESTRAGLKRLAPTITTLADAEGLRAHADSVRVRCANA